MSQAGPISDTGGGGGSVDSVSGTTNRITATPTTGDVVVDIAATYVGQSSITTLGTVTTGVWQGTTVGPTFGGTGLSSYTTGDIIYSSASNTLSKLGIGTSNQVLTVIAGIPSWQTPAASGVTSVSGTANRITSTGGSTPVIDIAATYVGQSSITTLGTIATGVWNGTVVGPTFGGTGLNSYTTGDVIYASNTNVLSKLAKVNNSVFLYNASGVPTLPTPPILSTGRLEWFKGQPLIGTASKRMYIYDDMYQRDIYNFGTANGGGFNNTDIAGHPGVNYIQTNSDPAGAAQMTFGPDNTHYLPDGQTVYETLVITQDLASVSDDYNYFAGFHNGFSGGDPNSGVYFLYSRAISANWLVVTKTTGTDTVTDSGIPVTAAWVRLNWVFDPTGPSVDFYINGSLVATHTTDIPTGTVDFMGLQWLIRKTAGTTNARISQDYIEFYSILTTPR